VCCRFFGQQLVVSKEYGWRVMMVVCRWFYNLDVQRYYVVDFAPVKAYADVPVACLIGP
jgi:hypothetical protein